jgi:hypothetical protein
MRYHEYFEISEKQGWRVTDLDWRELTADDAAGRVSEFDKQALVATAVIEHGVPHYGEVWSLVEGLRDDWELWQFTTLWTGEESRHSYALGKACATLGLETRAASDLAAVRVFPLAQTQKRSCPADCYRTIPGMLAYTVIQELATQRFYTLASKRTASRFVRKLLALIAADELRHHVFYRDALQRLYAESSDRTAYSDRVFQAVRAFKMPHLFYGVQTDFFEHGDWAFTAMSQLAFKAQLARCFAFDASLIARLMVAEKFNATASAEHRSHETS